MGLSIILYENDDILYHGNITHNLGLMANKANIYTLVWRPEEIGIQKAKDIIQPLYEGLIDLQIRPNYYSKFNANNGWGMYKDFVIFVKDYLRACRSYPETDIFISR